MEFDINLILVPVTLVFLVAYLADKFWLKRHKLIKEQNRQIALAQSHFESAQKEFKATLERLGHSESPDEFIAHENSPSMLINAHIAYTEAKRTLINAQGGADKTLPQEPAVIRWAYEYLPILLVIILVRSFVVEPFNIPSSSMVPSLYTGDFIVVNKASYGLRLPLTHTKILNTGTPKHGDVVVFRYPLNEKRYYIKRIIGVAGDTVAFANDTLTVNGQKIPTKKSDYQMPTKLNANLMPTKIGEHRLTDSERITYAQEEEKHARYYTETHGEHTYQVRYLADLNAAQDAPFLIENSPTLKETNGQSWQITVPEGKYFVMGDNRDRSEDGRFWGFVDDKHLAGKATFIWMHKEAGLSVPSFGRVGTID